MNETMEFLKALSSAESAEQYLEVQTQAITLLNGDADGLYKVIKDESHSKMMRFDAMQLLSWVDPLNSQTFFTELIADTDEEISELANIMVYRLEIRKNVETSHPEALPLYIENLRVQSVEQLF